MMKVTNIMMVAAGIFLTAALAMSEAAEYPFTGSVTGNNVNVRSGPDINFYTVAKLMRDNRVQVVGEEADWYKIVPPAGSFSWVSKAYVEKVGANKGVVSRDRVAIRAGSTVTDRKNYVQLLATKGQEVTIVGEEAEWYKIAPPEGAYVWVARDYVKSPTPKVERPVVRAEEEIIDTELEEERAVEEAVAETPLKAVTTRPAVVPQVPGVAKVIPTTKPAEEASTAFDRAVMGDFSVTLAKVDQQFAEEQKKPLRERNFDAMVEALKPIMEQKENPDAARYAKTRLELIEYQADSQDGLAKLQKIQKDYEREISRIRVPRLKEFHETAVLAAPYQDTGVLRPSLVFSGSLMPERYRLFDPEKCRTIAYVEIAPDVKINISDYLGKKVAVYGTSCVDAKLGYRVIQASLFKIIPSPSPVTNSPSVME